MKKKVLVVIDMQASFGVYEDDDIVFTIEGKIEAAMSVGAPIVFLEYEGHGGTIRYLTDLVENYPKVHFISKGVDDGSQHIMNMYNIYKTYKIEDVETFLFCGVNLEACVWRTVKGMAEKNPTIPMKILHDCCDSSNGKTYATNVVLNPKRHLDNVALVGAESEWNEDISDGGIGW